MATKSIIIGSMPTETSLADIAHALIMGRKNNFTVKSVSVVFKEVAEENARDLKEEIADILKSANVSYDIIKIS